MNWETEQVIHVTSGNYSQKDYLHFSAMGDDLYTTAHQNEERALKVLADKLNEYFSEHSPASEGIYATLINSSLDVVDWQIVAESVLETVLEMYF